MIAILIEAALRSLMLGGLVWLGLRLCRVRNPQIEATAWTTVLVAALAMPLLPRWPVFHVVGPPALPPVMLPDLPTVGQVVPAVTMAGQGGVALGALVLPGLLYLAVAGTLLLRLLFGLAKTWRIVRAAQRVHGGWTLGLDVRMTDVVKAPVSFGAVILLPMAWLDWPLAKRRAVICHERAHIVHRDFTVQLFAGLHAALFWFSPFAWWLQHRLAFLAERTADEAAISGLGSRIDYAEILLDIAVGARGLPGSVAMARPAMLRRRVESLLARGSAGFTLTPGRRALLVLALLPGILVVGGTGWTASAADHALADLGTSNARISLPGAPNFVLLRDGRMTTNASGSALDRLLAARGHRMDGLLFERSGKVYVLTEPGLVGHAALQADAAAAVGAQREELRRQEADVGRQHGVIGRQQGEIGRQMGIAARDPQAKAELDRQMAELNRAHAELGREEGRLAEQQARLESDLTPNGTGLQMLLEATVLDGSARRVEP